MSQLLSAGLLVIVVILLVTHFSDIKNSSKPNG
jgi:hypothetical protein